MTLIRQMNDQTTYSIQINGHLAGPISTMFRGSVKADSHIEYRAHAVPMPFPCNAIRYFTHALLRQCRVLCEIPPGSRKYLNCYSNSLTDRLFLVCLNHSLQS